MIFSDSLAHLYELVVFMMKFKGAIFAADLVALIIEPHVCTYCRYGIKMMIV